MDHAQGTAACEGQGCSKTDLHIHSKDGSDGHLPLTEIFTEARRRSITVISITDHDSIRAQAAARSLAQQHGMRYLTGVELNVTFAHPDFRKGKATALDFLGYGYDIGNQALAAKLKQLVEYRQQRAQIIMDNINLELRREGITELTAQDMDEIEATVDGSFGRPHIANHLVKKGIVASRQEAFDRYLVRCDAPKLPLTLPEAATLIHDAGGKLVLAHANDPNGTSLRSFTPSLAEQQRIIAEEMLDWIDGIECWHSRHDQTTAQSYLDFSSRHSLIVTGGSDCHQQPILMGSVAVPDLVEENLVRSQLLADSSKNPRNGRRTS